MKKVKESEELSPEYKREDLGQGVRGKYLEAYQGGTNLVFFSPDVAKIFSTEKAVIGVVTLVPILNTWSVIQIAD